MRRSAIVLISVVVVLIAAQHLSAQKSDCAKLQSTAEQADCVNHQLQSAESEMNAAFKRALDSYSPIRDKQASAPLPKSEEADQIKWDLRMQSSLRKSQEAWVRYREIACGTVREMYDGGTMTEVSVPLCKIDLTRERTKFLSSYFGQDD